MTRKKYNLINGDCLEAIKGMKAACVFADPPDNIKLEYDAYDDKLPTAVYKRLLHDWTLSFMRVAPIVWISFNARWSFAMGQVFEQLLELNPDWEGKPCVQVFTFGQHNKNDLGNNHRPLWRLRHKDAPLYPENVKVPSWRQRNGDKRAAAGGRVPGDVLDFQYPGFIEEAGELADWCYKQKLPPGKIVELLNILGPNPGDALDFPRVTGNSQQRCDWHPTQLHEDMVERCVLLSTKPGDHVIDPFGGTGTTLRVCKKIKRACTLIEMDGGYCKKLRKIHPELAAKKKS